jgi:hypothetical protein
MHVVSRGLRHAVAPPLHEVASMQTITARLDVRSLSTRDLERATGGGNAPLGGDVRQNINTNWGGNQTNINTQIVNPLPPPPPTTRFEYLRQNPAARFGPPPYVNRPVR